MALNIASARTPATLLSSSILLLLIASCSSASFGNVLKAGEILTAGGVLSVGDYKYMMQTDCNLVLYDRDIPIWSSRTSEKGTDCKLLLQNSGELFIISGTGVTLWRSETGGAYGKYVLVLQPNGNVVVYGNPVWSTGTFTQTTPTIPPRKPIINNLN